MGIDLEKLRRFGQLKTEVLDSLNEMADIYPEDTFDFLEKLAVDNSREQYLNKTFTSKLPHPYPSSLKQSIGR